MYITVLGYFFPLGKICYRCYGDLIRGQECFLIIFQNLDSQQLITDHEII